jgi:lysozyme
MRTTQEGLNLIKKFESLQLKAYLCPAGIPTIGYGATRYPDGKKIKLGEVIDIKRAEDLLKWEIEHIEKQITVNVNDNQFSALVSFAFNCGIGALNNSTILKRVKANPNDPAIRDAFMMWVKAKNPATGEKVTLKGLVKRRSAEADLYFKN